MILFFGQRTMQGAMTRLCRNAIYCTAGLVLWAGQAHADEGMLSKARVFYRPDGGVSITHFLSGSCQEGETETQCMDRITETLPENGLPHDDVSSDQLPQERRNRDKWRGEKGRGVWVDESLVTRTDKLLELTDELNKELDKAEPDAPRVLKLKRWMDQVSELDHAVLSGDDIQRFQEERRSRVAAVVEAVGGFFGSILDGLKQGILALRSLVTDALQVGSREAPAGITVYDFETGDPYCVVVRGGQIANIPGECGVTPPPPPPPPPAETPPPPPAATEETPLPPLETPPPADAPAGGTPPPPVETPSSPPENPPADGTPAPTPPAPAEPPPPPTPEPAPPPPPPAPEPTPPPPAASPESN